MEGGIAEALGGVGAPVEGAAGSDGEGGAARGIGAGGWAGEGEAGGIEGADAASAEAGTEGGGAGAEGEGGAELGGGDVGDGHAVEGVEVEQRVEVLVAAARSGPGVGRALECGGENIVLHEHSEVVGVVEAVEVRRVVDDVVRGVEAGTEGRVGQHDVVVGPVEGGDFGGAAAAVFARDVRHGVEEESHAPAAIADGRGVALVQKDVVHVVEQIVNDSPVRVLPQHIHAPGNRAGRVDGLVGARGVPMRVQEDVALNPGIRAVEVEMVVARPVEDVADDLQNRARPVAAREVDGVIEAPGVPEVVVAEDAVTGDGNAVHAVQHLGPGRGRVGGEGAVLDDERGVVEGEILHHGCARPSAVIEEDLRVVDMNLGVVPAEGGAAR